MARSVGIFNITKARAKPQRKAKLSFKKVLEIESKMSGKQFRVEYVDGSRSFANIRSPREACEYVLEMSRSKPGLGLKIERYTHPEILSLEELKQLASQ